MDHVARRQQSSLPAIGDRGCARLGLLLLLAAALGALAAAWAPGSASAALFTGPTNYPAGTNADSVAVGDFNGDSHPDLAVANFGSNDVSILLGGADGVFTPAPGSPVAAGSFPFSVAVADFNGDSDPDLAVANNATGDVSILLGGAGASFTPAPGSPYLSGFGSFFVTVGDFNGDSDPDLAVANYDSDDVTVLLGGPGASFTPAPGSPFTAGIDCPISLAVGDFNGDSDPDLVVTNEHSANVSVLLGGAGGTFTAAAASPFPVGEVPTSAAVGDFNGDSHLDLAVSNFSSNDVSVLLGNGAANFTPAAGSPYPVGRFPEAVVVGAFNGDSDPDIAVANFGANDISLLLGGAGASFTSAPGSPFAAGMNPRAMAVGNFNGDAALDLASANFGSNDVSILLGTPPPALKVDDVSHEEGNAGTTDYAFTVTRTGDTSESSSVHYATADGSASAAGGDYLPVSGELHFTPGELTKRVSVAVRGDTAPEPDEQFFLQLSAASNASIADGEGAGTIQNDDLSAHAPCTITGTNRADVLFGTPGDDVICAGNGDDRLYGGGGRDVLIGGNGDDRLEGGEGSDLLLGQNGKDELRGDAGNDALWGGQGKDSLVGGTGSDALFGGPASDSLDSRDASSANDSADGGGASDSCLFDPADFVASCP